MDGVIKLSAGFFVEHGVYLETEILSDSENNDLENNDTIYNILEIECGQSFSLKTENESITIKAPITILGPCLYLSARKSDDIVTLYLPHTSTPAVLYKVRVEHFFMIMIIMIIMICDMKDLDFCR